MSNFNAVEFNALKNNLAQIMGNVTKQKQILAELLPHAVFHASNASNNRRLEAVNDILAICKEFSDSTQLIAGLKKAVSSMVHGVRFDDEVKKCFVFKSKSIKDRNLIEGFENVNFLDLKPKKAKPSAKSSGLTEKKISNWFAQFEDESINDELITARNNAIIDLIKSDKQLGAEIEKVLYSLDDSSIVVDSEAIESNPLKKAH